MMQDSATVPVFDFDAFVRAFDSERRARGMSWFEFADEMWDQSSELNAQRPDDNCLCGGAMSRLRSRGATSCQYALFMLRWLGRAPEDFLAGPVIDVGDTRMHDTAQATGFDGTWGSCMPPSTIDDNSWT